MEHFVILRYGNSRVVLRGPEGAGSMTKHWEGHITFDYSAYDVVGAVTIPADAEEPTLGQLLDFINKGYAPGYNVPPGAPESEPEPTALSTGGMKLLR